MSFRAILSFSEWSMGSNAASSDIGIGGGLYYKTYIGNNVAVVPTADLIYKFIEYSSPGTISEDISVQEVYFEIQIPIAFTLPMNHMIYLTPRISFAPSSSLGSYGIHIGYLIPLYGK